jgi:hypothetical protein
MTIQTVLASFGVISQLAGVGGVDDITITEAACLYNDRPAQVAGSRSVGSSGIVASLVVISLARATWSPARRGWLDSMGTSSWLGSLPRPAA